MDEALARPGSKVAVPRHLLAQFLGDDQRVLLQSRALVLRAGTRHRPDPVLGRLAVREEHAGDRHGSRPCRCAHEDKAKLLSGNAKRLLKMNEERQCRLFRATQNLESDLIELALVTDGRLRAVSGMTTLQNVRDRLDRGCAHSSGSPASLIELPVLNELLPDSTCAGTRLRSTGTLLVFLLLLQDLALDRRAPRKRVTTVLSGVGRMLLEHGDELAELHDLVDVEHALLEHAGRPAYRRRSASASPLRRSPPASSTRSSLWKSM